MRVEWSRAAMDDLTSRARAMAAEHPMAARAWASRIRDAARHVGRFPSMGRRLPEAPDLGLRELLVEDWRIVYLPDFNRVYVLTVRHCSVPLDRPLLALHASGEGGG